MKAGRRRRNVDVGSEEVHRRLRQLVAGDREAAAWLYDRFAPGLFRRLRQRYGHLSSLEPDDLLQDAFVFYFQNDAKVIRDFLERVPPAEQTAARLERRLWDLACGVASNRRRSRALYGHDSLDTGRLELETESDERQLFGRDALERLDRCLKGYSSRVYLYYKLRFRDGHSPTEISRLTGWPRKATYKLRQSLNQAAIECAEKLGIPLPDAI